MARENRAIKKYQRKLLRMLEKNCLIKILYQTDLLKIRKFIPYLSRYKITNTIMYIIITTNGEKEGKFIDPKDKIEPEWMMTN